MCILDGMRRRANTRTTFIMASSRTFIVASTFTFGHPLVAPTFGHLHPDFLRFLWNFAQVDRNHPARFDLHRTGEVLHGYCGTDDEATKVQKAIFLKLKARVTSLVAHSAASRMLGYTYELEIKHRHRTLLSTRAHYSSYSLLIPFDSPRGAVLVCECRPL